MGNKRKKSIRQENVPGKRECESCKIKSDGVLDSREWKAIKYCVKNQIDKRKRLPKE